jgi:asparagine synthase (glutamine-hydrolysing)
VSGIAGIFRRDGSPAERQVPDRMLDAQAWRGPDARNLWLQGPVALGHLLLATTPEAHLENQPFVDGPQAIVLDGRVDDRATLRGALDSAGFAPRGPGDAELMLRAYEAWGETFPDRVIGDFAFAIWDGHRRQLVCGRDWVGVKPFFYALDARRLAFASEPQAVLADPSVSRDPHEGMVAECLAVTPRSREETLFRDVLRLPPAHVLVVSAESRRLVRAWTFRPGRRVRHGSDEEYAEHVRSVLEEAVACRLRASGRVGADLSGGIDSSSVVGLVRSLEERGRVSGLGFETFSLVFPEHRACDESGYIDSVVSRWRVRSNALPPELPSLDAYARAARRWLSHPGFPNGTMALSLARRAGANGFRVMLSGVGGDEAFGGSAYRYADLLASLDLPELLTELRHDRHLVDFYQWRLSPPIQCGLRPLVPDVVRRVYRAMRPARPSVAWIGRKLHERARLEERFLPPAHGPRSIDEHSLPAAPFASYAQRDTYSLFASGWLVEALELEERMAASFGLELRHPFLDRRVVELALALPDEQKFSRATSKRVLRRAMSPVLPARVERRTDKGRFGTFAAAALTADFQELLEHSRIGEIGWIEPRTVRAMLDEVLGGLRRGDADGPWLDNVWFLWAIVGVELWHRAVSSETPSPLTLPPVLSMIDMS